MQNKHPTIRPLLNYHRYQHQEEQTKHSHESNQGHHKTVTTHPMEAYTPPTFKPENTIDQAYNHFKEELLKMLDALAPQKVIKTTENCENLGSTSILDNNAR